MQDEEMDDIIRNASEQDQHYPLYNDKAWEKMEKLLDKHLPQEKNKKRYLFFLLAFVLLGGEILFGPLSKERVPLIQAPLSISKPVATTFNLATNNTATPNYKSIGNKKEIKTDISTPIKGNSTSLPFIKNTNDVYVAIKQKDNSTNFKMGNSSNNINATGTNKNEQPAAEQEQASIDKSIETTIDKPVTDIQSSSLVTVVTKMKGSTTALDKDTIATAINNTKKGQSNSISKISNNKREQHRFTNNLAFTLTAGPGFSYIGAGNPGSTTLTFGAGLNYTISKRFTVRTGFYVSSKIYSANPADYHPPESFWQYYPGLEKINANCKVYEIPLSIAYNFGQSKKHSWFGVVGLSSYLMKKEAYAYAYKDISGTQRYTDAEIDNKNKNIFSIVTLSGGYQYHFNNRVSIQAEPYIELPTSGIGFGQIKLNSMGLLFSIVIKPFAGKR